MAGVVQLRPRAAAPPLRIATPLASEVNRARILQVAARLSDHFQSSALVDPNEFFQLCFALARGIDYAVSHGDVPPKITELPLVIKQAYHRRSEAHLQPAVMVLLISVKNACRSGWFHPPESDELLAMAYEISNTFCWDNNVSCEEKGSSEIVSKVISRFYPHMTVNRFFASFEVKPGYEILVADIYIPRNITREQRIHLFVAQTDNIETSHCTVTPPLVNFLINGKGVEKRTNVSVENGPQFPSDITRLLKYGMNLFQAVGSFQGNYVIAIAVMTLTDSPDPVVLQDYAKPVPVVESDSDIIVGASRISLNCPISFKRITTPVKGYQCKHYQCFDYKNFLDINLRKPSWRCPHCNQSVSYIDIRIDRFMEKILKEAGEVSDVLISVDGAWEPCREKLINSPLPHSKSFPDIPDGIGIPENETVEPVINPSDVVDLTVEDYIGVGAAGSGNLESSDDIIIQVGQTHTEEQKSQRNNSTDILMPSRTDVRSGSEVAPDFSNIPMEICNESTRVTPVTQNQTWSYHPIGVLESSSSREALTSRMDIVASSPIHGGFSGHNRFPALPPSTSLGTPLPQSRFGNSSYDPRAGRPFIPRFVSRVPVAVQALPAHSQQQKRARTCEGDSDPISSSCSQSVGPSPRGASQPIFATKLQSVPNTLLDRARVADGLPNVWQASQPATQDLNSHLCQPSQNPVGALDETIRKSSQDHLQSARGGLEVGSFRRALHTSPASRVSPPLVERQQASPVTPLAFSRPDVSLEPPSEQTWRPMGRMRGALSGSEYSAAIRHYLETPPSTTPATAPRASNNATGTTPINHPTNAVIGNPSNPS